MLLQVADRGDEGFFFLPTLLKEFELFFCLGDFGVEFGNAFGVVGADGVFTLEDALLDFEVVDAASRVFEGRRCGVLA